MSAFDLDRGVHRVVPEECEPEEYFVINMPSIPRGESGDSGLYTLETE